MANKYMRKIFNILGHQGNTNQNDSEILSCPSHNGCHQENKKQKMLIKANPACSLTYAESRLLKNDMKVEERLFGKGKGIAGGVMGRKG
jgi:hypothetical protein